MKFPLKTYEEIKRLNPCWSSWVCFCEVVSERKMLPDLIEKHFRLIDKEDWKGSSRKELIEYLIVYTEECYNERERQETLALSKVPVIPLKILEVPL